MTERCRGKVMDRCLQIIKLLNRHGGSTVLNIAEELNISQRSAYRYIESASLHLPVYKSSTYPARYEIMKD